MSCEAHDLTATCFIPAPDCCILCGRNGRAEPLDTHHIFGGANRKKSEKYRLTVKLCHCSCHIFGRNAVHNNKDTAEMLHQYGQRRWMRENDKTVEDFMKEFGKNYL